MQDQVRLPQSAEALPAAAFGGAVLDDDALRELLQSLAVLACQAIDAAESVSMTVLDDGRYATINSTGPTALAIDEAQYRDGHGPCVDAIRSKAQLLVTVDDLPDAPRFVKEARRAHIGQILATPLIGQGGEGMGAVNIYVHEGSVVTEGDAQTARRIGDAAAILVGYAFALMESTHLNDQLREAVATRDIIGSAKGILMHSQSCTRDEAFDILRRASQRENRKLRELAEEIVLRFEGRASSN
jgi:GAF domain-containing protein